MLDNQRQDLLYALRQWWRAPGFVTTAVLTLALGIGGTTAMFTLVDAVLLRPLPVYKPEQLYRVGDNAYSGVTSGLQGNFGIFSYDQYKYFRERTPEFEEMAAFQAAPRLIGVKQSGNADTAQAEMGEFVSGNYFSMFGINAFSGRTLNSLDDQAGAIPVAVMSYRTWQQKYAGNPSVIGSAFNMNGMPVTLVGVAPPGFFGDSLRSAPPDFWISILSERIINQSAPLVDQPEMLWLDLMGRVQAGAQPKQIEAQMKVELQQWLTRRADSLTAAERVQIPRQTLHLVSGSAGVVSARGLRAAYETGLRLLMMVSGLVLLIVCANIANIVLVRALGRRRQASIRVALGAGRARLIAQALTENVLLALAGGACGLALAYGATKAILGLVFVGSSDVPVSASPSITVLVFAVSVSVVTGAVFGIVPAWVSLKADPIEALRGAGRSTGTSRHIPQRILVILQVALSLMLLAASGLLLQSLRNLEQQRFGFATSGRVAVRVEPFLAGYKPEQLEQLSQRTRDRLSQLVGVERVSASLYGPLSGNLWQGTVYVEGQQPPAPDSTENDCPFDRVGPGYFETIGTRLIEGRDVNEQDKAVSQHVAIVNESFVRRFFGRENPIGKHFGKDGLKYTADYQVVGVVEDAKYLNPEEPAPPMFFLPLTQATKYDDPSENTLEIRTQYPNEFVMRLTPGANITEADIRSAFAEIDPSLPVIRVLSFGEEVSRALTQQALLARLTVLFGLTALLLVTLGTYGVTAYTIQGRTSEIGIRMALGADRMGVLALIAKDAFQLVWIGLALGLPLTLVAGRTLNSRLYGVGSYDVRIIFGAVLALVLSATMAVLLPARRAILMTPMTALRRE
jgi:putative ABC transport system permease protein